MAILGSREAQDKLGELDEQGKREQIIGWLKFALTVTPHMQLTVKQGNTYQVSDVIHSRCEVATAFNALPRRWRWAIWDSLVKGRPPWEVALHMGVKPDTIGQYVAQGLQRMVQQVYESMNKPV